MLGVVDHLKPLHLSLVGGDPLVRYRELETLVPLLLARGIHVQVVMSAFRLLPAAWADLEHMTVVVSIDGLQPEHDIRRAPATYERILKNIAGQHITIHSTVTSQMMKRPGYLNSFLEFWTPLPDVRKVWFSLFTSQVGDNLPEILTSDQRRQAIRELLEETGLATGETGEEVALQEFVLQMPDGEYVIAEERFFLIRVTATMICSDGLNPVEQEVMQQHRWWSLSELEELDQVVFPKNLSTILASVGIPCPGSAT